MHNYADTCQSYGQLFYLPFFRIPKQNAHIRVGLVKGSLIESLGNWILVLCGLNICSHFFPLQIFHDT